MLKQNEAHFLVNQQLNFAKSLCTSMTSEISVVKLNALKQAALWQLCSSLSLYLVEIGFYDSVTALERFKLDINSDTVKKRADSRFMQLAQPMDWLNTLADVQASFYRKPKSRFITPEVDENLIFKEGSQSSQHWSDLEPEGVTQLIMHFEVFMVSQREGAIEC